MFKNENEYLCIPNLNCTGKYYSYDFTKCLDEIPNGYYCNDTVLKTLDKCHDFCETCEEGPTENNNKCLTCKGSKKLYLGNCVDSCNNGDFVDEKNITRCKCNDTKCLYCDEQGIINHLCNSCNTGYYPKSDDEKRNDSYINCYKDPENYYLDTDVYKPCYSTCKKCNEKGNENEHKCLECISSLNFKIEFGSGYNCYEKCSKYYYFDSDDKYQCIDNCSINYKLIIDKGQCIESCPDNYKYEYENSCYRICPRSTISNSSFYCVKNEEIKEVIEEKLPNEQKNISINDLNTLTEKYANSDSQVTMYENSHMSVYIYKNLSELTNAKEAAPQINFTSCYKKVQKYYNITEDLIITIIDNKDVQDDEQNPTYIFSDPFTGEVLNSSVCKRDKIEVKKSLQNIMNNTHIDEKKIKDIEFCTKQGINVFDLNDDFYYDLCFHFESPNGRDIPLQDRIAFFYPNITLCDKTCQNKGVDLENLKAICICTFNDFMSHNIFTKNIYGKSFEEFVSLVASLNIEVVKCIKDIFNKKYFLKCDGAFIFIILMICKIVCLVLYLNNGLYDIRKFFFSLISFYQKTHKMDPLKIGFPPRKKTKLPKSRMDNQNIDHESSGSINVMNQTGLKSDLRKTIDISGKKKSFKFISYSIKKLTGVRRGRKSYSSKTKQLHSTHKFSFNEKIMPNEDKEMGTEADGIREYLSMSFNENDFDDVIDKEKRTFFMFFCEKFQESQIIIYTFLIKQPLRPRPLKIMLFFLMIEIYFVVNALFYTEEYLSEIFRINSKDGFFDFVPRRFNQFVYIYVVIGFISYIFGYFFIEDKKVKKIFVKNKEGEMKIKYDISVITTDINKRFKALIIISFIVNIIGFVYISCFNIVYPNSKFEWFKSTIFIFIIIQLIKYGIILIECCIRYTAIKCNSNKLFRLSLVFS